MVMNGKMSSLFRVASAGSFAMRVALKGRTKNLFSEPRQLARGVQGNPKVQSITARTERRGACTSGERPDGCKGSCHPQRDAVSIVVCHEDPFSIKGGLTWMV